jgi:hypothetical protein
MTGRQQIQVFRTCTCLLDFPKKNIVVNSGGIRTILRLTRKKSQIPNVREKINQNKKNWISAGRLRRNNRSFRHVRGGSRVFRVEPPLLITSVDDVSEGALELPAAYRGGSSTTSAPSSVYTETGACPPSWCTT